MSTAIPAERRQALNTGRVPATHLAECLAVDFAALLQVAAPALAPEALQRMRDASGKGITLRMALAAQLLREAGQGAPALWQHHSSDTVRGWACYLIGSDARATLAGKLQQMRTLADDPHSVCANGRGWHYARTSLPHHCRRWSTCNRGHRNIAVPAPLRLRSTASARCLGHAYRTVQAAPGTCIRAAGSTGRRSGTLCAGFGRNWLNDAGKTQPQWLRQLCTRWQHERHSDANAYIRKRALRSLR